jgi:hypothetical protein
MSLLRHRLLPQPTGFESVARLLLDDVVDLEHLRLSRLSGTVERIARKEGTGSLHATPIVPPRSRTR